jgi:hypothetical protein
MKSCEPRDLLNRVADICLFAGAPPKLTPELIDLAWRNYFGAAHTYSSNGDGAIADARRV